MVINILVKCKISKILKVAKCKRIQLIPLNFKSTEKKATNFNSFSSWHFMAIDSQLDKAWG